MSTTGTEPRRSGGSSTTTDLNPSSFSSAFRDLTIPGTLRLEALDRYRDVDISMPRSTRRPDLEGTGRYGALLSSFLWLSDSTSMTDDAIRGMRRSYAADISVIDDAVGAMVDALSRKGLLDNTWIVYTSDHGEMAGTHGLMSKCVLYEPSVRVPLVIRPAGGCPGGVVDSLVEHLDVPATLRDIAGAPDVPLSEGRSLVPAIRGDDATPRELTVSENWGFAAFETNGHKLVVDEDAVTAVPALRPGGGPSRGSQPRRRPGVETRGRRVDGTPRAPLPADAAGAPASQRVHRHPELTSRDGRIMRCPFGRPRAVLRSPRGAGGQPRPGPLRRCAGADGGRSGGRRGPTACPPRRAPRRSAASSGARRRRAS